MIDSPKTAVFMDDEAAAQYVMMLKYWPVIQELDRIDFYHQKNGKVELHKDGMGNLALVVQHLQVRNYVSKTRQA